MRLFVGIPLPAEVRHRLASLGGGLPGARWVVPESLHVTLRFIGDIDEGLAEDIDAGLAEIDAPAFPLTVGGVGCFERGRTVHTVWAGVDAGPPLDHLHAKVESAVVRAGLPPEGRKFKPHITLARLRNTPLRRVGEFLQIREGFMAGRFTADRFTLFRSHLGREGALYEALVDYPLYDPAD